MSDAFSCFTRRELRSAAAIAVAAVTVAATAAVVSSSIDSDNNIVNYIAASVSSSSSSSPPNYQSSASSFDESTTLLQSSILLHEDPGGGGGEDGAGGDHTHDFISKVARVPIDLEALEVSNFVIAAIYGVAVLPIVLQIVRIVVADIRKKRKPERALTIKCSFLQRVFHVVAPVLLLVRTVSLCSYGDTLLRLHVHNPTTLRWEAHPLALLADVLPQQLLIGLFLLLAIFWFEKLNKLSTQYFPPIVPLYIIGLSLGVVIFSLFTLWIAFLVILPLMSYPTGWLIYVEDFSTALLCTIVGTVFLAISLRTLAWLFRDIPFLSTALSKIALPIINAFSSSKIQRVRQLASICVFCSCLLLFRSLEIIVDTFVSRDLLWFQLSMEQLYLYNIGSLWLSTTFLELVPLTIMLYALRPKFVDERKRLERWQAHLRAEQQEYYTTAKRRKMQQQETRRLLLPYHQQIRQASQNNSNSSSNPNFSTPLKQFNTAATER